MPRQLVLDYMLGRVTKHCPDFFDTYMKFNTNVESVRYNDGMFEIVTHDLLRGTTMTEYYDKCVWAAGECGRPNMPASLVKLFQDGGFNGRLVHSSDTSSLEQDVKGKRILLIGGAYSAEDLALTAIKVGVDMVYVSTRQDETEEGNVISWTEAWPYNKVQVLKQQTPVGVTGNGRTIQFAKTKWEFPDKYVAEKKVATEIHHVDTIIFCTGYKPNFDMLDESLREAVNRDVNAKLSVPEDWKMTKNKMTKLIGDVEPGDVHWINSVVQYPLLYRGLSIENPNMSFLMTEVDNPLLGIDVTAWQLLGFIIGLSEIPSAEEMARQNEQDALHHMNNPAIRYSMDKNFYLAYEEKSKKCPNDCMCLARLYKKYLEQEEEIYYRHLARQMQEANYPVSYGSYNDLNETACTIIKYNEWSYYHRASMDDEARENPQTFRDYDDGEAFRSLFTGTRAVSLKQRWLDIDASDENILKPM